ncbi:wall-associated receptor kinase 2-like [Quercus robur]|uniref:wall-associated receptor kinase 2-like n=1 Tax=Quercus robur TaxID=38942 RepID=UPI002163BB11|nr:wall-associated receptor kinase 2-like [Quercus robur]
MLLWENSGAMGFHSMLVLVTWVGVMLTAIMAAATIAYPLALTNCSDSCGDVKIPYPFGTTEGCYRNESRNFHINCNKSNGQPQPMIGNLDITNISIEGEMDIMMYNSINCYDKWGMPLSNNTEPLLQVPSFTVSVTKNKFVAVGCDTYAFLNGILKDEPFTTGCLSKCNNTHNIVNGSCSGIGCCQTDIPEGLKEIDFAAYSFKNHSDVWSINPCSFAFIIKKDKFSFSSAYLTSLQKNESFPMVLDWAIGNETCEVARNKGNYTCGANSNCIDLKNGPASGYRCKCKEGYDGNPYLKDGCQDIDECNERKICQGNQTCFNEVGSYHCSCIDGYHKAGGECVPNSPAISPSSQPTSQSSLTIYLAVGISIISLLVLLLGCSWIYWGLKKRKIIKLKEKFFQQNGGLLLKQKLSNHQMSIETTKIFTTEELKKATNNYDESRVLGQGGYGTVYRGVLSDNTVVAIKKSKIGDQSQIEQFINEMIVLTQINHRNVVKLFGCCLETEVPLLVYEFITNGTLFNHVHDKSLSSLLSWEKRLKIATEIAEALAYLHSSTSMSIIHRDVKTANILLDDDYIAKVADFGASRLVPFDQTQLNTLVQGTLGYLDPEYMQTSQLTEKSDVYSFGVVMAELLTGKKALSFDRPEIDRNLAISFVFAIKEDCLLQIIEDHIVSEGNIEQLKEIANLSKRCLSLRGEDRPFMKEVAKELERLRTMEKTPLGNIDVDGKKTEYLLSATSYSFNIDVGIGCSTSTTA